MHKKRIIAIAILTLMLASCDFSINSSFDDIAKDSDSSETIISSESPSSEGSFSTTSILATFTITWKNYDGTILEVSHDVAYGTMPVYAGISPKRTPDVAFTYTFTGWSPTVSEVVADTTYVAIFSGVTNEYIITWQNYDESILKVNNVKYGEMPIYDGPTPKRESNNEFTYTFTGWSPLVSEVVGDATYIATFSTETNKYTITWKNYDGTILRTDYDVKYGTVPLYKGTKPHKPSDDEFTYRFTGWSPTLSEVVSDTTYVATFSAETNEYVITWRNHDESILESNVFKYGEMPIYDGPTPERESDNECSYIFSGWSPAISEAVQDTSYVATFTSVTNEYTVTWQNYDGTILSVNDVAYAMMPVYLGPVPTKESDDDYHYIFAGWSPEISEVVGDVTYVALFNHVTTKLAITWNNYDGTHLSTSYFAYGEMPIYDGDVPTRKSDDDYNYIFTGWSPTVSEVVGEVTYVACFDKTYPARYTLANDADFSGDKDGEFIYIGSADYVAIPETIKGVTVTKTLAVAKEKSLFSKRKDVKGVMFMAPQNIVDTAYMFYEHEAPELDLTNLDTTNVTNMRGMFASAKTKKINFGNFNTANVTNMHYMFAASKVRTLDLHGFDTTNVQDMSYMFASAQATTLDISSFNTANVINMQAMFAESEVTTLDLRGFDTSHVRVISEMFSGAKVTTLDVSTFDTSKIMDMHNMFAFCDATILDLSSFDTSRVASMNAMFLGAKATTLNVSSFDTSQVSDMGSMFFETEVEELDLRNFDTSRVTSMDAMFAKAKATTLNVSSFDTSQVSDMRSMFFETEVVELDLSNFDTAQVTSMRNMFSGAKAAELKLSNFNTSQVTDMSWMFANSEALTLDLSSFDTSAVTNMSGMFASAQVMELDLSNFDTSQVTNMRSMFSSAQATTIVLDSFDTKNVIDMSYMFYASCVTELNVSSFNTLNVEDMSYMFAYIYVEILDLRSFDTTHLPNMDNIFREVTFIFGYARNENEAAKFNNILNKNKFFVI